MSQKRWDSGELGRWEGVFVERGGNVGKVC